MPRWGADQDLLLWRLYSTNEIDPSNNEPEYLFESTQRYFKEFITPGKAGRDRAIARIRQKNRIRLHQLRRAGVSQEDLDEATAEGAIIVLYV